MTLSGALLWPALATALTGTSRLTAARGEPPITVGFNPDFAPFSFTERSAARGIVIERVTRALESAGIPFVFSPVALSAGLDSLTTGNVDALAGVAPISPRRVALAFSRPLVMTGAAWFAARGGPWPSDSDLLKPHEPPWRAVTPATGPLVALIRERFPLVELRTCEDYDSALRYVIDGDADAAALNWHVGRRLCQESHPGQFQDPKSPFHAIPLVVATKAGDPGNILARLNDHIPDEWGLE